jgi:hypothetical protein
VTEQMSERKPLTAAKVRAVMKKAGHRKSESHTTRVKGWHSITPGYVVYDGTRFGRHISVAYRAGIWDRDGAAGEIELDRYSASLKAAGIEIDRAEGEVLCLGYQPAPV